MLRRLQEIAEAIQYIKLTSSLGIRVRPLRQLCVATFTDSSLCSADRELVNGPGDVIAKGMYSQGGCLVTFRDPWEVEFMEDEILSPSLALHVCR